MFPRFSFLRSYDWFLTVVVFILASFGLLAIYSVDLSRGESLTFFPTQLTAFILGFFVFFAAGAMHKVRYESGARLIYLAALLLLVLVLIPHVGTEIRGTHGWFRFGGVSFQPAEFAKLALVILLGWLIHRQARRFDRFEFVVSSGLATGLLGGLILMQPDLGSASILFALWFILLFFVGVKKRYLFGIVIFFIILFVVGWFFLFKDYQKGRFTAFLHPEDQTYGYNVRQSIIAIGSGKLFGRGLGFGSQSQLHFLPEAQTDFIFSVIGEELGFVGIFMLLTLYFLLFWRLTTIARAAPDDFSAYTTLGIASLFFVQMLINIGGAAGMLPITGVTLPFVSYGGTSLIMNFFLLGVAESIARSGRRAF